MVMSSNFLKSSGIIKIQISRNQRLNDYLFSNPNALYTYLWIFLSILVFNTILIGLFTSFSISLKMRRGRLLKSGSVTVVRTAVRIPDITVIGKKQKLYIAPTHTYESTVQ